MIKYSDKDVIQEAMVFVATGGTIASTAKMLGVPRSTVHWHIRHRLPYIDLKLSLKACKLLTINKHSKGRRKA